MSKHNAHNFFVITICKGNNTFVEKILFFLQMFLYY